jgi:DNA-binding CsgD family transcriptional regulator
LPRPKKLSSSTVEQIVSGYSSGQPIIELARRFGVHRATISGHLDRAGVTKRLRSMSEAQIDIAVQDYAAGQSLEKIGNRLGFDSTTVLKELRLRDVKMRDTHGRERPESVLVPVPSNDHSNWA